MFQALGFFANFSPAHVDWLVANSQSRTFIQEAVLVKEGDRDTSIHFITSGVFDVVLTGGTRVAQLGAGEVVGEISWLDETTPSATIRAVENGEVLSIAHATLNAHLAESPVFASQFHRAVAKLATQRLRAANAKLLAGSRQAIAAAGHDNNLQGALLAALDGFKTTIAALDQSLLNEDGRAAELETALAQSWQGLMYGLDDLMRATPDAQARETIGALAKREMLPYFTLSQIGERWHAKPRGYAGDYLTIEHMYRNEPQGTGRIGPAMDRVLLNIEPTVAVRNRRGILREEIAAVLARYPDRPVHITSMACGPARELLDVFDGELGKEARERLFVTALDIDLEALALLDGNINKRGLRKNITPVHGNLIYLATGRQKLDQKPQDLMYSIGLIDYFDDKFVIGLMNWIHSRLAPAGRCILGNFDPSNRAKAAMDWLVDWRLIHRTEGDMSKLYQASSFAAPCSRVLYEAQRINLFAECVKPA
jgi:extracellular factor (EF) 3-hydroxypalmitic acid methyl ester biosynthesis protein